MDIKSKNETNSDLQTPDKISLTNESIENFLLIEEANKIQFSGATLFQNPHRSNSNLDKTGSDPGNTMPPKAHATFVTEPDEVNVADDLNLKIEPPQNQEIQISDSFVRSTNSHQVSQQQNKINLDQTS